MERTPYERVIGGTEEERELAFDTLQKMFEERSEELEKYELPKTPEDREIIENVVRVVDEIVEEYGGDPVLIPVEKIHILKPGSVLEMTEGKLASGIHKPLGINIGVEKGESRLLFASTIAHELFHAKSYKAARIGKAEKDIRLYRSGIGMVDRKDASERAGEEKEYFGAMEEAIVAECTKRAFERISASPSFREEVDAVRRIGNWATAYFRRSGMLEEKIDRVKTELKYIPDAHKRVESILTFSDDERKREAYAAGMFKRLVEEKEIEPFERYEERRELYNLLDRIVEKSGTKFGNQENIFSEFARANFSGNYMPIARIVESAFGDGSFRRLADEFSLEAAGKEKMNFGSSMGDKNEL